MILSVILGGLTHGLLLRSPWLTLRADFWGWFGGWLLGLTLGADFGADIGTELRTEFGGVFEYDFGGLTLRADDGG